MAYPSLNVARDGAMAKLTLAKPPQEDAYRYELIATEATHEGLRAVCEGRPPVWRHR